MLQRYPPQYSTSKQILCGIWETVCLVFQILRNIKNTFPNFGKRFTFVFRIWEKRTFFSHFLTIHSKINERTNMASKELQKNFFKQIQTNIDPISLIDELINLLHISASGAYRRINGETLMSIEELTAVLNRYPMVSFESFIRPQQIAYNFPSMIVPPQNMFEFLDAIEKDITQIAASPNAFISYAAMEVPFFQYLLVPEIAAFKLYMWSRTVWHLEGSKHQSFELEKNKTQIVFQSQIERIAQLYASIAGEEIWNNNMLDITLNQIRYCYHAGRFKKKEDVPKLFDLLRGLIQKLNNIIIFGEKRSGDGFAQVQVWYNELVQNNAFILVQLSEKQRFIYTIFDAPNFMNSSESRMCAYSQAFFNRLKSYSLPLNEAMNDNNRLLFINRLNKKVNAFEQDLFDNN